MPTMAAYAQAEMNALNNVDFQTSAGAGAEHMPTTNQGACGPAPQRPRCG